MRALAHLLLVNALLGELVRGRHFLPLAIGIEHVGRRPPVVLGIATGGRVGSIGLWSAEAAIERDRCVEACRWREARGRSLSCCACPAAAHAQLLRVSRLHQYHGDRLHHSHGRHWRHEKAHNGGAHEHAEGVESASTHACLPTEVWGVNRQQWANLLALPAWKEGGQLGCYGCHFRLLR